MTNEHLSYGGFLPEECREIARSLIRTGRASYPGGGTEPPDPGIYESATVRRARAQGISVKEYRSEELIKERLRRESRKKKKGDECSQ